MERTTPALYVNPQTALEIIERLKMVQDRLVTQEHLPEGSVLEALGVITWRDMLLYQLGVWTGLTMDDIPVAE